MGAKKLYYLSFEFLMGRLLCTNILNLMQTEEYQHVLNDLGYSLPEIAELENDAGLGNGGLGRLAACFIDSLTTLDLPAYGCTIRYEYGLFRQKIVDGYQTELPDHGLITVMRGKSQDLKKLLKLNLAVKFILIG